MEAIDLNEYTYELPDDRIAKFPLNQRDQSKLLHYQNGSIHHRQFHDISTLLPADSNLFFNNTKVIPARIYLNKATGAQIEIFLLNPVAPSNVMSIVMEEKRSVVWQCMIGNLKKWKEDALTTLISIDGLNVQLSATLMNREKREVRFEWENQNISFAQIVEHAGQVPLPPYLNRKPNADDKPRYQTVYSENEGAVAAPTAGLHFTDHILAELEIKGIRQDFLTLHVSAGTFQPIKVENAIEHPMHSEQIVVSRQNISNILSTNDHVIAVGTTSMRTLESLYWFGVRLLNGNTHFHIEKLEPYSQNNLPEKAASFGAILDWMDKNNLSQIVGSTKIFIFPGYDFKVCNGLITNFHQPGSTLMLLVAAFVGKDWKKIYEEALENRYRFLSYGDSSLLLPS